MSKHILLSIFILLTASLVSCDAVVHLSYSVENKTSAPIQLFVPNYSADHFSMYNSNQPKDTAITLAPNEKFIVGGATKIDFPWGAKNIYKDHPGKCGLKIIERDTLIDLKCTQTEWKYQRRNSNLQLK